MTFTRPYLLLLLLILPLVLAVSRRRWRSLLRWTLPLRLLLLTLLIFALAGLAVVSQIPDFTVVFLLDGSDSIDRRERQVALDYLSGAVDRLPAHARAGLVVFAGKPAVVASPAGSLEIGAVPPAPMPAATDIGAAIRSALDLFPQQGGKRIVLLSDGGHNRGDLEGPVRMAQAERVEVSVFPLGSPVGPEVLVERVIAPAAVAVGEAFSVIAALEATEAQAAQVRLVQGGRIVGERQVNLRPGQTLVTFSQRARASGLLRYEVAVLPQLDTEMENNRGMAYVSVQGEPSVLYVAEDPGPVQQILSRRGFTVTSIHPGELPSSPAGLLAYDAVVLDDVPATSLSQAQMASLRDYVGELGGGLVAFGGPHSFGVGGYGKTPLEEALPVSMDVRHRLVFPSMAIVLVLDTSGSMGQFGAEPAKVELAKETAIGVVDLVGERDLVGVIAFDQDYRWLVPLMEASRRAEIEERVSQLRAGGGTNMYPALEAAKAALETTNAKVKHVIVLSDGQTDPGEFGTLVRGMAHKDITVTAVAVGNDADTQLMRQIAEWGLGRYYHAKDPYTLPQILTAEAMLATKAYLVEEPFSPKVIGPGPLLDGINGWPPLYGYVATTAKPASEVLLASPQEDPILAIWQYGLGRAVAFTADARPRWAADWLPWPPAARVWSEATRWVLRQEDENLQASATVDGTVGKIALDARTPSGDPMVDLQVRARVVAPSGRVHIEPLIQKVPGWYEGTVNLEEQGGYAASVEARSGKGIVGMKTVSMVLPYSPELRAVGSNRSLLGRLVEATGGRFLTDPGQAVEAPATKNRQAREVWGWLTGGGLIALITEVTVRRAPALGYALSRLLAAVVGGASRQRTEAEEQEDQMYLQADRWRQREPVEQEETRISSMEHAARLYIARLKAMQGLLPTDREGRSGNGATGPTRRRADL